MRDFGNFVCLQRQIADGSLSSHKNGREKGGKISGISAV